MLSGIVGRVNRTRSLGKGWDVCHGISESYGPLIMFISRFYLRCVYISIPPLYSWSMTPPARMFPAKGMSAPLRSDLSYPCLIKPHMFSSLSLLVFSEGEREKKRKRRSAARSISGSSNSHCSLLPICFYFQELRGTIELAVLSGVCSHRENQNKCVKLKQNTRESNKPEPQAN